MAVTKLKVQYATNAGTAALYNVGTSANNIVQLNSSAQIPAVDGSLLTGLTKTQVGLSNVENTALSTWAGTSNIVTLGTITTGVWNAGMITSTPAARSSGVASYFKVTTPADTGITTATESIGVSFAAGTRTWVDGTVTTQREHVIAAPTYNKTTTSATFTKAATLAITAAPIAGTGVTITNAYSLWVQAGMTQLDGWVRTTGMTSARTNFSILAGGPIYGGIYNSNTYGYGISIGGSASDYGVIGYNVSFGSLLTRNYIVSDKAGWFDFGNDSSSFIYYTAPSGTSGNAATGTERFRISSDGSFGINCSANFTAAGLLVKNKATTDVNLILKQIASQTGDMTQWQNSGGTVISSIDSNGCLTLPDGTQSYPAIYFRSGSANAVGLYQSATNTLAMSINGNLKFKFSALGITLVSGNVIFANNSGLIFADSGATTRDVLYADESNNLIHGSTGYAWASQSFCFNSSTPFVKITSTQMGVGTASPDASAVLDVQSTTKGLRFPNMTTTQKNAISSPAAGLVVMDTTLSKLCVYTGAAWQTITST